MSKKFQDVSGVNFNSVSELNRYVDKVKINISSQLQCKQYCRSASDIFQKAEARYNSKDEENAYILYMRCLNIYMAIRKSYEFVKAKNTMEQMLVNVNPNICVTNAEKLLKILEVRYEKKSADLKRWKEMEKAKASQNNGTNKSATEELDDLILPEVPTGFNGKENSLPFTPQVPAQSNVNDVDATEINTNGDTNAAPTKKPTKNLIGVSDFYDMLKVNKHKLDCILIIDIRTPAEFLQWKIQHEHTINIPPTCLPPGASRNSLERQIRKDIWETWNTRFDREYIVIVDDTFDENVKPEVLLAHPAVVLQEILCKCEADYGTLILVGGLQKWVLHYPSLTVNPDHKRQSNATKDVDVMALIDRLGSYPSLPSSETTKKIEEEKNNLNKPSDENDRLAKMRSLLNESEKGMDDAKMGGEKIKGVVYPSLDDVNNKPPLINNFTDSKPKEQTLKNIEPNGKVDVIEKPVESKISSSKNIHKELESVKDSSFNMEKAPKNINQVKPSNEETKKEKSDMPTVVKKNVVTTPGLPYGWQKQVDQNTGKIYYIDHNTKTTHWKLPLDETNVDTNGKLDPRKSPNTNPQKLPTTQTGPSLPSVSSPATNNKTLSSVNSNEEKNVVPNSTLTSEPATVKQTQSENTTAVSSQPQSKETVRETIQPPSARTQVAHKSMQDLSVKPNPSAQLRMPPKPPTPQVNTVKPTPQQPSGTQVGPHQEPKTLKQLNIPSQHQIPQMKQPTQPILKQNVTLDPQTLRKPTPPSISVVKTKVDEPKNPSIKPSYTLDKPKQPSLKRSNSSPNLAEGLENLRANRAKTPIVDRMSKPTSVPAKDTKQTHLIDRSSKPMTAGRLRSLSPVYGSQGMCLTGLKNLGNTCYMNSVLQCLLNTPPLERYFVTGLYEKDMNNSRTNINPRPGHVAREFSFIMKVLSSGAYRSVSPIDFKLALGSMAQRFLTYEQQDSHEVLLIVLDGLHNDVNKAITKTVIQDRDNSKLSDTEAAEQEWEDYQINNDSRIFNLFYGQFRSTVSCLTCRYQSKTFNTFNCLHLQLPVARMFSLAQCLELFIKPERIDSWHCKRCNCERPAAKIIELWKLPPVLIVQFKRFRCEGIWTNKVQTPVDYPITNWDLSKYITGPNSRFSNFSLYGIINHSGSFESGHYTSRCKNAQVGGGWFLYNDERIQELDRDSIKTKDAYVLLYTAVNFEDYLAKR